MVGPVVMAAGPPVSPGMGARAGHRMDSSGTYRLAHRRAIGRDNDIDNGNTAAIIASRMEGVAPVQPGQRAEKSGGGITDHRLQSLPFPRRIRRFLRLRSSG
ncbi:hypothetical protein [Burkholderia ambifaria]|uniref:hypothetical protein n=1 Tax=Burkholderia ambifaria TaxID=152480 RepID=UPI0012FD5C50|nr:hypothetical protein [Burkholderia ambifaria]